jgi:Xaa-Pro aminopeptidase
MNEPQSCEPGVTHLARAAAFVVAVAASTVLLHGQGVAPFQRDFPVEELAARRTRVLDAIGPQAIAVLQGAAGVDGFKVFRQANEFYYLTGVETPHAYLVLDGRTRRTTLYLPRRNEALERGTGTVWSAEDPS